MNESFNIKRFLALLKPLSWKRQLIAIPLGVVFLSVFYSFYHYESSNFTYAVVFFGLMHQMQFKFMSSQSDLAGFILLPATNMEKYLALFIKAILFPTIMVLIISIGIHLVSMNFPDYSTKAVFKIDLFYSSILLFVILFCLRFVLRWNSFIVYFIIYFLLMIPFMFANKYIHDCFGSLTNYQFYLGSFYILLSAALVLFTFPKMKKLVLNHIKEKVDKL